MQGFLHQCGFYTCFIFQGLHLLFYGTFTNVYIEGALNGMKKLLLNQIKRNKGGFMSLINGGKGLYIVRREPAGCFWQWDNGLFSFPSKKYKQ